MAGTGMQRLAIIAALLGLAVTPMLGPDAAAQEKVGVNSAVNPQAEGTPPSAPTRRLELGQDVVHDERIVTQTAGQTQVLFLDASAMTVGPSSDVTIDDFVYDPNTNNGKLAMSMTKGVMRFVGGKVSKLENGVTVNTPSASMGVRGGVFLLSVQANGQVDVIFLYGKGLVITANNQTQLITHPGWSATVAGPGASPSKAAPATAVEIASLLNQLVGRVGSTGGATRPPTEFVFTSSNVPGVISGNLASSTQQATQNSPPQPQLRVFNVANFATTFQINDVSVQKVLTAVAQGQTPGNSSSSTVTPPTSSSSTTPSTPTTPTTPTTPSTPTAPVTPPNVPFPTVGVGSFSGTAAGTVVNNGSTSQATGNFSQVYNFGSQSGIVSVNNFDGANYGYNVTGSGANFSGSLASGPANRTGSVSGAFSGPGATQTGGSFGVQSTTGPTYTISGTFSGK
jgi:trimeric autotransporter adhesin